MFISEYAEGSANNKYIELYNPTSSAIYLEEYTIGKCSNGCDALGSAQTITGNVDFWTFDFPSGSHVLPGGTFIVAHPNASQTLLEVTDMTYMFLSNGDDTIILVNIVGGDTTVVDIIGDLGPDPGIGWDVAGVSNGTQNHTLVRKPSVQSGNGGNWTSSAGTTPEDKVNGWFWVKTNGGI